MKFMRLPSRLKPMKLRGWTFIETLVVIGIVLILTASVGFMAFKYLDQAKQATAKSQIETLSLALNAYYFDTKKLPTSDQGLGALWQKPSGVDSWNGPYLAKAIPKDPWDGEYQLKTPGPNGLPYEIISLGADHAQGGSGQDADLSSAQ